MPNKRMNYQIINPGNANPPPVEGDGSYIQDGTLVITDNQVPVAAYKEWLHFTSTPVAGQQSVQAHETSAEPDADPEEEATESSNARTDPRLGDDGKSATLRAANTNQKVE